MLAFQDRIADTLAKEPDRLTHGFRRKMETIQSDFLKFTQQYWFAELTSQLQGRELFALMQKHSDTKEIYEQLIQEISNINQVLNTKAQEKQTNATNVLSGVATFGLALALTLSALATPFFGFLRDKPFLTTIVNFICVGLPIGLLMLVIYHFVKWWSGSKDSEVL
jgi:hypothetical protein